jgi:hypothetical protein
MDARNFQLVNNALITLIPKSAEAAHVKTISLIHIVGKLISKVLAPKLDKSAKVLLSEVDSYRITLSWSKHQPSCCTQPTLLLKVDIARAFDSVSWPFLLEVMEHMGFPRVWRDWASILLSTTSTWILMSGTPGDHICHAQGLHQGDPLSPMLFLLVMEVLSALIHKADGWSLLRPRLVYACRIVPPLYADDLVFFIALLTRVLQMARCILDLFHDASGLGCNLAKFQMVLIRCMEEQMAEATNTFPCQTVEFPVKYLGIPLSVSKLPKLALQPLLDRVADCLPIWKGRHMHRSGRLALNKSTMTAIPVFTSTSVGLPPWLLKAFRKVMRAFLWTGTDAIQNGKVLVARNRIQRPLHLGGAGVLDLRLLGIALCFRWLWLQRTDSDRAWAALACTVDSTTQARFDASVQLILGDGSTFRFWIDPWLHGARLADLAPDLSEGSANGDQEKAHRAHCAGRPATHGYGTSRAL